MTFPPIPPPSLHATVVAESSDADEGAVEPGMNELPQLQAQTEAARIVLARLQEEVVVAESRLSSHRATQLLQSNEQLVLSMLRALNEVKIASGAPSAAELDALTSLPNRILFQERLKRAIANAKPHKVRVGLMCVDVHDFENINETRGRAAGDDLLKLVAQCLVSSVRAADTVSRHGSKFLILIDEVSRSSDLALIAEKVCLSLRASPAGDERPLSLHPCIGISICPDDGEDADALIACAEMAMSRAKKQGPGYFAFHGKLPMVVRHAGLAESEPQPPVLTEREAELAEREYLNAQLREANEQLVLAALRAQALQAAAEQAHLRQTELLAVVAHELRNPLTPISTAAALMGHVDSDAVLLPKLQAIIERQVMHMSRLVSDLLDVSRVAMGKLRIERQAVNMRSIIDAAVEACQAAVDIRKQTLSVYLPDSILEVNGDPVRLAQIISNLLDNASKYTQAGGKIGLSVMVADNVVVIAVSDNGIGIAAEALLNVFEPFMQDPHAVGFNGVGLGIGLTVVRELVEAHGGNVAASSPGPGLGSLFVVTLPLLQ